MERQGVLVTSALVLVAAFVANVNCQACHFYPLGENRRFERVAENIKVDDEVFKVQVYPRNEFKLEAVDNSLSDINYFKYQDVDEKTVAIRIAKSLEDLVDSHDPQSVLKFKLTCRGGSGTEEAFLPVTVYIQDINDHAPEFQNTPYHLDVDELTPVGLTVFRGIRALDRDKPNTANSDVTYSIVGGNGNNSFVLSDPIDGILVVNKPLDYDHGVREFQLQLQAKDHGTPVLSSVTKMTIRVRDADDQNPLFTSEVYKANVSESLVVSGATIRQKMSTEPKIHAFDQDTGINARLRYNIILGNDKGMFELHEQTGELFLVKELDLEALPSPTIILQIQATQMDNPLRYALARIHVSIQDINDNMPQFEFDTYNITVMENLPPGFTVVQVFAVDADQGDNSKFVYQLDDSTGAFKIDPTGGWISVKDPNKLDRETKDYISMKVRALERRPNVNPNAKSSITTVEIHLLDANDNNPEFQPNSVYTFRVIETDLPGTVIGRLSAIDPDLGDNGRVRYFKQNDSLSQTAPFDISPQDGAVFIMESFSNMRVKPANYTFFVKATDMAEIPSERRTSVAVVHVNVTDVNNNPPQFLNPPFIAYVGESLPPGAQVYQITAKDPDSDTILDYSIVAGNDEKLFYMNNATGMVLTAAVLDYEVRNSYDLLIQASDGINTAVSPLTVRVVDINDNRPRFSQQLYNFSVVEEMKENLTIGTVLAKDKDSGKNSVVRYTLVGDQANDAVLIDERGNIITRRRLDREKEAKLNLIVVAFDSGIPQLSGTASVAINVEDINDNVPVFGSDTFEATVPEEKEPPFKVFQLKAEDFDAGDNAVVKYAIVGGNEDKLFGVDENSGIVFTTSRLDYEIRKQYVLHVAARNIRLFQGPEAASLSNPVVTLVVRVVDINDERVVFERQTYHFRIPENAPRSITVGILNATNPHRVSKEQDVNFWIGEGNDLKKFWMNPKTGELVLMDTVDRDYPANQTSFRMKAYARDNLSINSYNSTVPIIVDIEDVNDNSPVFDEQEYALELPESLPVGTELPAFFRARDIDFGNNGRIDRYYINTTNTAFQVNGTSGALTLLSPLDYEKRNEHIFVVMATDKGNPQRTGTATVKIKVQNINEYSPEFVGLPYQFWVQESAIRNTRVGEVKAFDADGNNVFYSITGDDADFFAIEETTGRLYVKKDLPAKLQYKFVVRATDDGLPQNNSLGVHVAVRVRETNDYAPSFTNSDYKGTVREKEESAKVVVKVAATDLDLQENIISYSISNGNDEGVFTINNSTGEIRVTPGMGSKIDYDKKKKFILVVQARDSHHNPLSGIALVQVDILDTNDHAPMFQKSVYSASLIENLPAGHCFLKVVADSGDTNDVIKYFTDGNLPFLVDSKTGDVCTKTVLDREQKDKYDFTVLASDGKFETLASISIDVLDENDNPPKFENNRYVVSIPHTSQPGRSIIQIHAADPDSSNNGDVTYWIKNTHGAFEIDAKTGLVRLASTLPDNFSLNKTFEMEVFAQDHGAVSNIAKTMLVVRVSNTENQPPKFNAFVYSVFVDENKSNIGLVTVKASDPDSGKNGKVVYRIARATNREAFRIDPTKGKITLVTPLDYETTKYLELVVEARDEARDTQFSTALVQVTVIDRNDNAPEFLATPSVLRVPQSTSQSEVIYTIQAVDKDSPANGHNDVTYSLVPPSGLFAINPKTGQIFAVQPLTPVIETLHIVASDGGNPPLSSTMDVAVEVYKDSIDEPTPVFSAPQYHINMDGLIEAGSTILETRATVPNGSPVAYNISDAYGYPVQKFAIDLSSGKITATSKITAAAEPLQHFLVTAYNRIDPRRRSTAGVVVKLKDTNSRCPKFPFTEYYAMVKENTPPDAIVLHNIAVDEPHQFTSLNYQITEDNSNDNFVIDHRTVNVSMRIKNPLDRDSMSPVLQGFYTITVTASNGRCTGSSRVRVYVEDVNDNSPIFEKNDYVVELKENSPVGHVVLHLKATDKDQLDNLKLKYFIVLGNDNQQFILEEKTGVLSVNISPDREKTPAFRLQVIAVDSANNTGLANVHVIILDENDWKPTFLNKTFILNVTEGPSSVGASIHLPIVDNDEGVNRQLEVYIADGNTDRQFKLGVDKHGQAILTVSKELDREKYNVPNSPIHVVVVAARDMGSPAKTGSATVAVVIHDINDSPPKFEKDEYYSIVSESVPIGTIIDTVKATDPDTAAKTNLTYGFGRRSGNIPFALDPITGSVNITRQLDISVNQEFTVPIEAFDGLWKNTAILKVFVREAEERDPRFNKLTYKFQVPENVAGAVVGQVELKPRRTRANSQMRYTIVNTDVRNLFNITKDGIIYTKTGLDRENRSAHTFTVMLEEKRPSTRVSVSEVTVEVLDVNDEIPKFMQNFKGNIKENSPSGSAVTVVPAVSAVDNDSGNNSIIRYSLIGPGSEIFSVFDSGVVVYTPREPSLILDRESKETYKLKVVATDRGNLSSTADLTITIEDENDNAPQFQHGPLHVLLPETARPGTRIAEVKAIDRDAPGPNSKIQYNIIGRRTGDIRIDRETGEIFVVATLQPSIWHLLNISAVDGHGLASFTSVNVTVVDINDHRPRFERADYRFSVQEGNYSQGGRYKVGVVHAIDEDTGRNGKIDYATIVTSASDKKFPFSIDVHTGELFATGVVDREKFAAFRFKVMALDNGEPPLNSTVEVRIDVEDINDEVPKFFTDPYLAHVPENLDPGHKVTQITAFDPDSGANGQVFYRLGNGHQNKFYIDSKDGTVWTLSTLDYEEQAFYNMTVIAYDHGSPSLSATAKLWVTVADTNDALPDFPKSVYTIELAENTHVGESVYTLDAGEGNFKYFLTNTDQVDTFEIERGTGQVRLIKPLDSLQKSHYRLMVKAVDDSDPPRSDTAEVNILIGTGHGVRLFPVRMYEVNVAENQLAPLVVLDLNATDETAHRRVAYSIVGSDYNGLFIVEPESGRISVTASLDREKKDKYSLKVRVENLSRKRYGRDLEQAKRNLTDQPLAFDEALVLINVADENDNPPVFENHGKPVVAAVPLEATFGYRVAKVSAADSDIGLNAALRYDIIRKDDDASSKFHIDPVNGIIRSMITFSLDGGHVYSFDVKATDREGGDNGNTAVSNVFVYVLPETRLVLFVAGREPLIIERHIKEIVGFLTTLTGYKVMAAKLEPHHEGDSEDPESTDLFLYAVDEDTNEIVDTEVLLSMFRENSQVIVEKLEAFRILRIQGVSVQEKISQMGATEMAIIALSSVIFLGAVLGITLLCTTCKKRRQRRHQKTWEQQRLYNIKNPLMGKTVGNPYGSRKQNGSISHISATYANGEVPGSGEYSDSLNDDGSLKKNNKKARHMMAPDGASSINASRASQFERYNKNETNNWYDMRDGVDSIGTGFSKSSAFTSWSSRHSRRKPVTEL